MLIRSSPPISTRVIRPATKTACRTPAAATTPMNENIVLIDRINQVREECGRIETAVIDAAVSRFRPILLTSVTTFVGLLPIMAERSSQSEYLKPMTLSLGFGVAFASFVTLIMVPCLYVVVEDARAWFQRHRSGGNLVSDTKL